MIESLIADEKARALYMSTGDDPGDGDSGGPGGGGDGGPPPPPPPPPPPKH